jgi:ectoine hydroxylase-related dioxygenase (phytanoyl-CoA dioxygenase family)
VVAADLAGHFAEHGWVVVDALDPEVVLQHFEGTDDGPLLCRTEHFVQTHAGLRQLLCEGGLIDVAGALLGEPALLYKEKVNHKLAGGAGYRAHQDAPAYPMIDTHVSAMVAVDDADAQNGGLEVVSGCFDAVLPVDERGCIEASVAAQLTWEPVTVRAGQTLWFHSRTPHRSGPNRSSRPRRALYPTYNAAREGDRRAEYYATKEAVFAGTPAGDRARVSLIGDFEGRPA